MRNTTPLLLLAATLAFAQADPPAAGSAPAAPAAQVATSAQAAPSGQTPAASQYRIQPGDTIDVRFFYNPELNEQGVQVRPDGRISLQLVGDVDFAGQTVEDLSRELEKRYAADLKSPRISIQIRGYAAQKAFISGEVPKPGVVSLATPMTVLAAIGEAGGITIRGNRNRVVLIRKMPDGRPARQEVVLFAYNRPTQQAMTPLQPFDVILVPESGVVRVGRWVDQYIRQLSPANLFVGFNYLWQHPSTTTPNPTPTPVPF